MTSALRRLLLVPAVAAVAGCTGGDRGEEDTGGADARITVAPIDIREARIPENPAAVRLAVYAEIENRGVDDALVELRSPIAGRGSIHLMQMSDGMMTMVPTPALDVPAGRTVTLRTGDVHGMLEELVRVPDAGEVVDVTFVFASGAEVLVRVPVVPLSEIVGSE